MKKMFIILIIIVVFLSCTKNEGLSNYDNFFNITASDFSQIYNFNYIVIKEGIRDTIEVSNNPNIVLSGKDFALNHLLLIRNSLQNGDGLFIPPERRNALLNKVDAVIQMVMNENFNGARIKIVKDVLPTFKGMGERWYKIYFIKGIGKCNKRS
uniref:Lipoprotein n=1 Tax=candidate division WOR-3 bacterium TaxID=2052148 RepID=A0A7C4YQJ6_UNCW3